MNNIYVFHLINERRHCFGYSNDKYTIIMNVHLYLTETLFHRKYAYKDKPNNSSMYALTFLRNDNNSINLPF